MNAGFLFSAVLMLLGAVAFAAAPLIMRKKFATNGPVNGLLLVVAAVPVFAVALYGTIGRPDIAVSAESSPESTSAMKVAAPRAEKRKAASVNDLLAGLEQRLQENPDDAEGWLLLAKSHDHLGHRQEAATAYAKAEQLGLEDRALEARLR